MKKQQVVVINGGMTFSNKKDYIEYLKTREISLEEGERWHESYLSKKLGRKFQIIKPKMPKRDDAKYEEWKISFERYIPYFEDNIMLIGISLGGIFLAKYLSENKFPKKIKSIFLVCPPYDNSLPGEDLAGGFELKKDLSQLELSSGKLFLLFSENDDVVPLAHAKKYGEKLPNSKILIFDDKKGHFKISEFPEIVRLIKKELNSNL